MRILFCGGGALGSHGLFLARDLEHELAVVDFDRVETKNLASQWFVKQMIGKNKATAAVAAMAHRMDPSRPTSYPRVPSRRSRAFSPNSRPG